MACSCGHHHGAHDYYEKRNIRRLLMDLKRMLLHAGDEFFGVGKYLVIGAFITSLIQTFLPKELLDAIGMNPILSLMLMMTAAFLFSACSTSDAFIARSFLSNFTMGSIMGFLVFGPMMDTKNLLMLLSHFKKSFVLKLTVIIAVVNFIWLSVLIQLLM